MRYRRFPKRRISKYWFRLFAVLALTATALLLADARLRPQLHAMAAVQACATEESALNDAVLAVLENGSWDRLVTVEQNADGVVTAIRTDALKLNLLKSRISAAAESVLSGCTQVVRIPFGSLTGLDILAGRGPYIRIPVQMTGYAAAEIESVFSGAGINQTIHRLFLRVHAVVCLSMAKTQEQKELTYEVCIAETVIVGTVPQMYANLGE